MALVIDASMTLAWCLEDERDEVSERILRRLQSERAFVPAIWTTEVPNGLLVAVRRGRLPEVELSAASAFLLSLPVAVEQASLLRVMERVLDYAQSHGLTVYDATYLEAALRLGLPLATLDERLRTAATRAGVTVLT